MVSVLKRKLNLILLIYFWKNKILFGYLKSYTRWYGNWLTFRPNKQDKILELSHWYKLINELKKCN